MTYHDLTSWILFCWLWTDLWGFVQWYLYKGPLQDDWTVFEDEHNHYCQWTVFNSHFLFHTETRFFLFFFWGGGGGVFSWICCSVPHLEVLYCRVMSHSSAFFYYYLVFLKNYKKIQLNAFVLYSVPAEWWFRLHIFRACVFVWDDNAVFQSGWQWWYFMFKACVYVYECVQASVNTQRFNFQETKKKKSNCYWT